MGSTQGGLHVLSSLQHHGQNTQIFQLECVTMHSSQRDPRGNHRRILDAVRRAFVVGRAHRVKLQPLTYMHTQQHAYANKHTRSQAPYIIFIYIYIYMYIYIMYMYIIYIYIYVYVYHIYTYMYMYTIHRSILKNHISVYTYINMYIRIHKNI